MDQALRLAREKELDLVEVAAGATPPVCRIVNYGKFLYEEAKRNQGVHQRNAANRMKEIQISPTIDRAMPPAGPVAIVGDDVGAVIAGFSRTD